MHNQVYGFDQQRLICGMFFACGVWCLADISSVNPSSEQVNAQSVSISQRRQTDYISTFVDQTHIQPTCPHRKTVFFKTSLPVQNKVLILINKITSKY